jgi:hypothetical protein
MYVYAYWPKCYYLMIIYKVWLWSSRDDFIASIPVHLQLAEKGNLQSIALE